MRRTEFHALLQDILGSKNVYYQPPAELKMKYPCIRYEESHIDIVSADNHGYLATRAYSVTYITKQSDSDMPLRLARLPMCRQDRSYRAGGLYHETFTIYI